jgi:hypothetical protein
MSYLDTPRLHFTGHFQADVSTINNVVGYFDTDSFDPAKDQKLNGNGGWNPEGTAIFHFISCTITGGQHDDRQIMSAADDPVIGMALDNANDKVFGKRPSPFDHVLGDARLRDLKPELEQFAVDAWRAQKRILHAHSPDQRAQLRVDLRSPSRGRDFQRQ